MTILKASDATDTIETELVLGTIQITLTASTAAIGTKSAARTVCCAVALHVTNQAFLIANVRNLALRVDSTPGPTASRLTDHRSLGAELVTVRIPTALCPAAIVGTGKPVLVTLCVRPAIPLDTSALDTKFTGAAFRVLCAGPWQDHLPGIACSTGLLTDPIEASICGTALRIRQARCANLRRT